MIQPPPISTLFTYTTLFRSRASSASRCCESCKSRSTIATDWSILSTTRSVFPKASVFVRRGLLLPPKVEASGAQLAVIVHGGPLLDVVIWAIEDKDNLLHMAVVRPDVRAVHELEGHAIGIAAGSCYQAGLVVRRTVVGCH